MDKQSRPKPAPKVRGVYEHPPGSGIWWCQYFHRGERHRERVGRRADAIALYQQRKADILRGEKLPELGRKRVLFGELLDDALAFAREHDRVLRNYSGPAERLREALGRQPAEELTHREFSAWITARGGSPATFNRYRAFISLVYREGQRNRKVGANPAQLMRHKKEPKGRYRFLDRLKEYPALLARIEEMDHGRAQAFRFAVHSGARLSEQFGLTWRFVDFDRRTVTFVETKNGDDRTIPMNQVMLEVLEELSGTSGAPRSALVFGSLRQFCCDLGAPLRAGVADAGYSPKWFRDLCRELGIADYTWHNNRHTFCSWLAIDGASLKEIQELAGHRSITTTARYSHLSPDTKRTAMDRLVNPQRGNLVVLRSATKTATGA